MAKRFYVYELIDPRCGSVFYVGKGSGRRMYCHEGEARGGVYSRKCSTIREIWAASLEVKYRVVEWFADEIAAYAAEIKRIAEIGLDNLTNVQPGGLIVWERAKTRKPWTARAVMKLAPKLARALRLMLMTGGIEVAGVDVTNDIWSIVRAMCADCGDDLVRSALTGRSAV
jgi:hypothetical protein